MTGLLTLADADRLLTASGIRTPAIRLVADGRIVPEAAYTMRATLAGSPVTGLVDGRRVLAQYDDGATVVFQGLQRYWPPLTALIAQLESELGHPCQANAYLTPPNSQGFAVHADTHDVFVVQTAGRKRWQLADDDGASRELDLVPGVVLYLPTGTRHAARAQTELSLHVTIGINQLTMRGLMQRSVAAAIGATPDRHLPVGFTAAPRATARMLAEQLRALAERIVAIDPEAALEAEVCRVLSSRPARLGGGLLDRADLPGLTDDTMLRRRPGQPCVLRTDGPERIRVLLGDRILTVPGWVGPALDIVAVRERLCPADLAAHLDEHSRIVLCRRLIREGLLRVER